MKGKQRLFTAAATLAAVAAVIALATGVTFGFFSATTAPSSQFFTAGTVTLEQGHTLTCTLRNIVPGNGSFAGYANHSTNPPCTLDWKYTGSEPAYLAVDVIVFGTPATPVTPYDGIFGDFPVDAAPGLFDGSMWGLQLSLSNSGPGIFIYQTQYINDSGNAADVTGSCSGAGDETGCAGNGLVPDLFLGQYAPGDSGTITLDYGMPGTPASVGSDNAYQGASTEVVLKVHAVQAENNGSVAACTVGHQCSNGDWS